MTTATKRKPSRLKLMPVKPPVGDIARPVPPFLWGKDHWSTFGYAETRIVDHSGRLGIVQMRTNWRRHPLLRSPMSVDGSGSNTRLAGFSAEIADHDDWDCLLDMEAAGLLIVDRRTCPAQAIETPPGERGKMSGLVGRKFTPQVALTPLGAEVAGLLRTHKAAGGSFGTFVWVPKP